MSAYYEYMAARLRFINEWQVHNPTTGFYEWKPGAPAAVKRASEAMSADARALRDEMRGGGS